jgi:hypothetical protein
MKPFLQGKETLSVSPLKAPPAAPGTGFPSCGAASGAAIRPTGSNASVEVVKEGDKVVRLIVTCVCGERVEVECLYSAGT